MFGFEGGARTMADSDYVAAMPLLWRLAQRSRGRRRGGRTRDRDAGRGAAIGVLVGGLRQRMQQNKTTAAEQQAVQQQALQPAPGEAVCLRHVDPWKGPASLGSVAAPTLVVRTRGCYPSAQDVGKERSR